MTLSVGDLLGHLEPADNPKLALAAALYLHGSIRARVDGRYEWHKSGAGKDRLQLELPRLSLTNDHVRHIATRIAELWEERGKIRGLRAVHEGEWCDEAIFAPASQRILVETPAAEERSCEPCRTAILEPVEVVDKAARKAAIERAGEGEIAYVSFEMSVNMAGGQPFSMNNVREVSAWCQRHDVPLMFDATRCCENARMVQLGDPAYRHVTIREILREMMSYGDGCTVSCKKDFLVNMGGLLACNDDDLAHRFREMLRIWEGEVTTGGMDPKDMEAMRIGLLESFDDNYIAARVGQTRELGRKLNEAGIPIVNPPGSHAIFLDARSFLPHLDQDEYPAQALAAAIFIETGVRAMERGNVSKGRDPKTKKNYRPALELVRLTIPRRVYTNAHFDFVVEGISRLWERRERISGLEFAYEPELLRFFQGRFEPKKPWDF